MSVKNSRSAEAKNILGSLGALASKPKVKSTGKADRWQMPLTPQAKADATRWLSARVLLDPIESREETAKAAFNAYALGQVAERLWESGNKPSNPTVVVDDHEFMWIMQDSFSVRFPECPEGVEPQDHLTQVVQDLGFHPDDAARLVCEELNFAPIIGFRPISELLEGRYGAKREFIPSTEVEQSAGRKLAALIGFTGEGTPEPLNDEERSAVLERSTKVVVNAGFFSRVKSYCRSVDQVKALLTVIVPRVYPRDLQFAKASSEEERLRRTVECAADILGYSLPHPSQTTQVSVTVS